MPPRIQSQRVSNSILPYLSSSSSSSSSFLSPCTSHLNHLSPSLPQQSSRSFSSTEPSRTRHRDALFAWLNTEGANFKNHTPGSTYYLSDALAQKLGSEAKETNRPFPLNPAFVSEPILSEELRNEIHKRVMVDKKSIRAVSAEVGVDMKRVAAVCRLVELENRMRQQGKPLALPYARTVHEMVRTTPLYDDPKSQREHPHESINDLPAHRLTDPQIFYPVSESRQFNRVDAGRVFSAAPARLHEHAEAESADPYEAISRITQRPNRIETVGKGDKEQAILQPADVRIPHPHLISYERDRLARPREGRETFKAHEERLAKEEAVEQERKLAAEERREANTTHVNPESSRFEFRFKNVVVSKETTGADGRGAQAPGRRYGVPSYDRKKGQVKIPTRVVV